MSPLLFELWMDVQGIFKNVEISIFRTAQLQITCQTSTLYKKQWLPYIFQCPEHPFIFQTIKETCAVTIEKTRSKKLSISRRIRFYSFETPFWKWQYPRSFLIFIGFHWFSLISMDFWTVLGPLWWKSSIDFKNSFTGKV